MPQYCAFIDIGHRRCPDIARCIGGLCQTHAMIADRERRENSEKQPPVNA